MILLYMLIVLFHPACSQFNIGPVLPEAACAAQMMTIPTDISAELENKSHSSTVLSVEILEELKNISLTLDKANQISGKVEAWLQILVTATIPFVLQRVTAYTRRGIA